MQSADVPKISCPFCEKPLTLEVLSDESVDVYRDGDVKTIFPDVITCHHCGKVLFATVSAELDQWPGH